MQGKINMTVLDVKVGGSLGNMGAGGIRGAIRTQRSNGGTDGELREQIGKLAVRVFADHVGRGPTRVRAFLDGDIVVCLLEDTMTRAERSLVAAGREAAVLSVRRHLQEMMCPDLVKGIEALTGRAVTGFVSGNSVSPDLASELFVLGDALEG